MNIYSGSGEGNGLAAALTNPTALSKKKGKLSADYPVLYRGFCFVDAETAYKVSAAGAGDAEKDSIMIDIITNKLLQYPALYTAIAARGGVPFLETCSHVTAARNGRWEGAGRGSRFIRNLIAAYEAATVMK